MTAVLFFICVVSFLWWLELALEWAAAARSAVDLDGQPAPGRSTPRLSVIIPARNEENALERALTSVLAALPDNSEAILLNDRSTDKTGSIAKKLASADKRLRVLTIRQLPEGWLGKNHAMWEGYRISSGDYLLFTDADVIFEPGCLVKAVALCEDEGLDHLVATPEIVTKGFWERTFISFFSILLMARYRIWRAADPKSNFFAGIGAFNMVRRKTYEESGTHKALKGEAVDDLLLGRLMKQSGGRSKVVSGKKCLKVRWNIGLRGLMEGLEKNSFAAFDYSLPRVAVGTLVLISVTMVPILTPVFTGLSGEGVLASLAALAGFGVWSVFIVLYGLASYPTGASWLYFITLPAGVFLMLWTILRSALLYYVRGGVKWRGTVYKQVEVKNPESRIQNETENKGGDR